MKSNDKTISLYELDKIFESIFRVFSIITIAGLLMQMVCSVTCLQAAIEKDAATQKADTVAQYIEEI